MFHLLLNFPQKIFSYFFSQNISLDLGILYSLIEQSDQVTYILILSTCLFIILRLFYLINKLHVQKQQLLAQSISRKKAIAKLTQDLKTSLNVVSTHVEALEFNVYPISTKEKKHYINIISNKIEHLSHLTNRLKNPCQLDKSSK